MRVSVSQQWQIIKNNTCYVILQGFADKEYRERRKDIAKIAFMYRQ